MIRGILIRMLHMEKTFLWSILKDINVEEYDWYNIGNQNEVWYNPLGDNLSEVSFYDGNTLLQYIQSNHYVIFIKLQAYLQNAEFRDIHTYEDFRQSNCQLLLLAYDGDFFEIYAKNQQDVKTLYKNASKNEHMQVEYITESNDNRTVMNVL